MLYREIIAVCFEIRIKYINIVWNEMNWNYIYLLHFGFHPVAVVGRLVRQNEKYSTKGETIHKKYKNTEYTK